MKKKLLALVCAMALTVGMSMSVCAASSPTSSATAESVSSAPANTSSSSQLVSSSSNATGQSFGVESLAEFAETTTVAGVKGASISAVSADTARGMITEANKIAGEYTFIAAIVDLNVPAGTGEATFTIGCPNVWKGQNVTILHQLKNGSYETIKPSKVANNKVTFTMTSYSPIAIVINTKSPKTGEIIALVAAMAAISGIGAAAFGRKARKN